MCFVLCEFSIKTLPVWMKQWHKVSNYIGSVINFVRGHNFNQNVIWIPLWWKRSLFVSRVHDSRIKIRQSILFVLQKLRSRREAEPETAHYHRMSYYALSGTASSSFVCSQHSFRCPVFLLSSSPSRDTLMINLTDSERLTFACAFQSSVCMLHVSLYSLTSWFLLFFVPKLVIILMNMGWSS